MIMDPKQRQLISSCSELQDELVGCGHQLQQINALLDILWRATCYDATHGGYPEVVQLARRQIGEVSDRVVLLADRLSMVDRPVSVEHSVNAVLNADENSQLEQTSDIRLQSVDPPIQADLDRAS